MPATPVELEISQTRSTLLKSKSLDPSSNDSNLFSLPSIHSWMICESRRKKSNSIHKRFCFDFVFHSILTERGETKNELKFERYGRVTLALAIVKLYWFAGKLVKSSDDAVASVIASHCESISFDTFVLPPSRATISWNIQQCDSQTESQLQNANISFSHSPLHISESSNCLKLLLTQTRRMEFAAFLALRAAAGM